MIKIIISILLLSSLLANAQTTELVEVVRRWPNRVDIDVVNNLVHTRIVSNTSDTAFYYRAPEGKMFIAVTLFKEVITTPTTEKIDGELATFTGTWVRTSTNPGWFQNTIAFSNTAGSTASYTFTGTKIELW